MKKAFTMIEMLVVIAIIGILAAVIMGTFSGGTESAQTAKCLTNMRNLAAACQSAGVESGRFPLPSSLEHAELKEDSGASKKYYLEYDDSNWRGWISWNSHGYKSRQSIKSDSWRISMYSTDRDAYLHSLTNGSLWTYLNGNQSVYVCANHKKLAKKKGYTPQWSYVMNAYFNGSREISGDKRQLCEIGKTISTGEKGWWGISYRDCSRTDRRLLFAEIPYVESDKKYNLTQNVSFEESGDRCDSVLQYSGFPGVSSPECIGFNHKAGKQRYCANVVFADGHTEKLLYPKDGMSEGEIQNLTEWLCTAIDVSFDGKTYDKMDN